MPADAAGLVSRGGTASPRHGPARRAGACGRSPPHSSPRPANARGPAAAHGIELPPLAASGPERAHRHPLVPESDQRPSRLIVQPKQLRRSDISFLVPGHDESREVRGDGSATRWTGWLPSTARGGNAGTTARTRNTRQRVVL